MIDIRTLPQREEVGSNRHTEAAPKRVDPYWNFIARTALMYSLPVLAFAVCLGQGWVGSSRDFWVPLLAFVIMVPPATKLRYGRPVAFRDYQGRDRFPWTYGLLPASIWCLAIHLLPGVTFAALAFWVAFLVHDALLIRFELLSVYLCPPEIQQLGVVGLLPRVGLSWWSYFTLAMVTSHLFGSDSPAMIAAAAVLVAMPVGLLWRYWRKRGGRPERFGRIRRVAVVGGGWSGIYAVKALHEAGIDVTCYEGTDAIGGVWKYRHDRPGGVFEATRVTSSKHFLHASDFPLPATSGEFPCHTEILAYLNSYVDHFGIRDRFHVSTSVQGVEPAGEFWRVVTESRDGERKEDIFDAVVVSSGPHQNANIKPGEHPVYGAFTGRLIHSAEYKTNAVIAPGERVLIVGAGESSADIVSECVNAGAEVHWASRSGQWFADRNMGPYPADHITTQGLRVFAGLFGFWSTWSAVLLPGRS